MRALNNQEIDFVGGAGLWADFVSWVKKKIFGNDTSPLADSVNVCVSSGGTASYTFSGGSGTISWSGGGTVPVDGIPVTIGANGSSTKSTYTYSGSCTPGKGPAKSSSSIQ